MIMYRTTALFIGFAAVVGLSACGSSNDTAGTSSTPATVHDPTTADIAPDTTLETPISTDITDVPITGDTTLETMPAVDVTVLTGRTWVATNFITVGGLTDITADPPASVEFDSEDHVLVDTGCNTGSASVVIEGDQFTIGPVALTKKACAQDSMDLETHIVALLQEPSYWSVDGDSLKVYPANITDTGVIFHDGDLQVAPPETFQTTS